MVPAEQVDHIACCHIRSCMLLDMYPDKKVLHMPTCWLGPQNIPASCHLSASRPVMTQASASSRSLADLPGPWLRSLVRDHLPRADKLLMFQASRGLSAVLLQLAGDMVTLTLDVRHDQRKSNQQGTEQQQQQQQDFQYITLQGQQVQQQAPAHVLHRLLAAATEGSIHIKLQGGVPQRWQVIPKQCVGRVTLMEMALSMDVLCQDLRLYEFTHLHSLCLGDSCHWPVTTSTDLQDQQVHEEEAQDRIQHRQLLPEQDMPAQQQPYTQACQSLPTPDQPMNRSEPQTASNDTPMQQTSTQQPPQEASQQHMPGMAKCLPRSLCRLVVAEGCSQTVLPRLVLAVQPMQPHITCLEYQSWEAQPLTSHILSVMGRSLNHITLALDLTDDLLSKLVAMPHLQQVSVEYLNLISDHHHLQVSWQQLSINGRGSPITCISHLPSHNLHQLELRGSILCDPPQEDVHRQSVAHEFYQSSGQPEQCANTILASLPCKPKCTPEHFVYVPRVPLPVFSLDGFYDAQTIRWCVGALPADLKCGLCFDRYEPATMDISSCLFDPPPTVQLLCFDVHGMEGSVNTDDSTGQQLDMLQATTSRVADPSLLNTHSSPAGENADMVQNTAIASATGTPAHTDLCDVLSQQLTHTLSLHVEWLVISSVECTQAWYQFLVQLVTALGRMEHGARVLLMLAHTSAGPAVPCEQLAGLLEMHPYRIQLASQT